MWPRQIIQPVACVRSKRPHDDRCQSPMPSPREGGNNEENVLSRARRQERDFLDAEGGPSWPRWPSRRGCYQDTRNACLCDLGRGEMPRDAQRRGKLFRTPPHELPKTRGRRALGTLGRPGGGGIRLGFWFLYLGEESSAGSHLGSGVEGVLWPFSLGGFCSDVCLTGKQSTGKQP
jgi:hypothetical protein